MERGGDRALPVTRGQLDIWLAQQAGHFDAAWQLGVLVRIDGAIDPRLLHQAMRHVVNEAESLRASFFEADGQVFQKAVDYDDVDLVFYDLTESPDPEREVRETAASIQRTPMPLTGPMIKFALFRTGPDEYYWFTVCHHIAIDGMGIALTGRRIAAVYSALAAGKPVPPPSSAPCMTSSAASWNTRGPPNSVKIKSIGSRTAPRAAGRTIRHRR